MPILTTPNFGFAITKESFFWKTFSEKSAAGLEVAISQETTKRSEETDWKETIKATLGDSKV
jgi:hypothetical protein